MAGLNEERELVLLDLPIEALDQSNDHLQRVLAAVKHASAGDGLAGSAVAMAEAVTALETEYADIGGASSTALDRARADHAERVTVRATLPLTAASTSETWLRLVEYLDDFAARGEIPVEPASDRIRTIRRWVVEETVRQVREGRPPRTCTL